MMIVWVLSILLPTTTFASLQTDEFIKEFVSHINGYMKKHNLDHSSLPNVDMLYLLKAVNGSVGDLSSFELLGEPFLNRTRTSGFTVYNIEVTVKIKRLVYQYDWIFDVKLISKKGHFSVSVGDNAMAMTAQISVTDDGFCKAAVLDLKALEYTGFMVDFSPQNFRYVNLLLEAIMDFNGHLSIPIINVIFRLLFMSADFTNAFSDAICDSFRSKFY